MVGALWAIASGVTLAIAGLLAAFAPGDSFIWLMMALVLLGLGWNFGLISGTAIIIDSTNIHNRAKVQGSVDVWVALSGTAGSFVIGCNCSLFQFCFIRVFRYLFSTITHSHYYLGSFQGERSIN